MIAIADNQKGPSLVIEPVANIPAMKFRQRADGTIMFRYLVNGDEYPGFDGRWRVITLEEQRQHLNMGGQIAEWLNSLGKE